MESKRNNKTEGNKVNEEEEEEEYKTGKVKENYKVKRKRSRGRPRRGRRYRKTHKIIVILFRMGSKAVY
jgi:hypothetical protein